MVSKPSHHEIAVRNSLRSKCVPGSPEERTVTQEVAKEAEAERRRALFAGEDKSYKLLKDKLSSLWERDHCEGGDSMADSGEMASEEETKLLKRLTALSWKINCFILCWGLLPLLTPCCLCTPCCFLDICGTLY